MRGRARRAIPLIAAALAVALVAGLIYLRPGPRLASTATPRPSPTQSVLAGNYSVDYKFISPSVGWALIYDPSAQSARYWVFATTDGAVHWTQQVSGSAPYLNPGGLVILDRNHGFFYLGVELLPGGGVLALKGFTAYASFDGGDTWRVLAPAPVGNTYTDMAFAAEDDWWAMHEGVLFKSRDRGQSWREVALQFDSWEYRVQVLDSRHAWARLRQSGSRQTLSGLAFTVDGGLNWTNANVPRPG